MAPIMIACGNPASIILTALFAMASRQYVGKSVPWKWNPDAEDARAGLSKSAGCCLRGHARERRRRWTGTSIPAWRVPDDSITREGNVPFNSAYTILGLFLSRATRAFLRRRRPAGAADCSIGRYRFRRGGFFAPHREICDPSANEPRRSKGPADCWSVSDLSRPEGYENYDLIVRPGRSSLACLLSFFFTFFESFLGTREMSFRRKTSIDAVRGVQ